VQQSEIWKRKDVSKIQDFTHIDPISDWTYSTAFKGSVRFLSKAVNRIKNMTGLDMPEPTVDDNRL